MPTYHRPICSEIRSEKQVWEDVQMVMQASGMHGNDRVAGVK